MSALQRLAERVDRVAIGLHTTPPEVCAMVGERWYMVYLQPGDTVEDGCAFILDCLGGQVVWPDTWGEGPPTMHPLPYAFPVQSSPVQSSDTDPAAAEGTPDAPTPEPQSF